MQCSPNALLLIRLQRRSPRLRSLLCPPFPRLAGVTVRVSLLPRVPWPARPADVALWQPALLLALTNRPLPLPVPRRLTEK